MVADKPTAINPRTVPPLAGALVRFFEVHVAENRKCRGWLIYDIAVSC
jgi:hypothetical protein